MTEFEQKAKEMCEAIIQHYEADIIYQSDPFEYCYKLAKATLPAIQLQAGVMPNEVLAGENKEILNKLILAMRDADNLFEDHKATGTKTYLRDYFLPELAKYNLIISQREA